MIEKMVIYLVDQMKNEKLIGEGAVERYIYVLIISLERMIVVGTIIFISLIVQIFFPTLFFLLFFFALRKRTGGYHLDKFFQCYWCTIASYLLILVIGTRVEDYFFQLLGILLLSICVIEIIGTVNHPNMHMNSAELDASKNAARMTVLLEGSIILCCVLLGVNVVFISYMAMAVILCAVLLCIAKILKQEVNANEES